MKPHLPSRRRASASSLSNVADNAAFRGSVPLSHESSQDSIRPLEASPRPPHEPQSMMKVPIRDMPVAQMQRSLFRPIFPLQTAPGLGFCAYAATLFAGLSYAALLVSALFATPQATCNILQKLDAGHTCHAPVDRGHAQVCDLSLAAVWMVMDRFVIAHGLGYMFKGIVLQNRAVLWGVSAAFEVVEVALSSTLPNFQECWWDRLFMDVLLFNFIGIEAGVRFAQVFPIQLLNSLPSTVPAWRSVMQAAIPWAAMLIVDLNAFLIKAALNVPVESPLNVYRILITGAVSFFAARQYCRECQECHVSKRQPLSYRGFLRRAPHMLCLVLSLALEVLLWYCRSKK